MNTAGQELREVYDHLKPGDQVEVVHGVTVGSSAAWRTTTVGKVLRRERRRHGPVLVHSSDNTL